ncbi:DUF2272 domain-containing protein [Ideonella sp.]|uniref:DUF2272 domain-containing protein n=1 Tax=Ideonella sp. TaxID=1929293 RepID=UPI0035B43E98
MRRVAALASCLAAIWLSSCGTPMVLRPKVPPTAVPPEKIARLLAEADAEWARWGRKLAHVRPGEPLCLLVSDGSCRDVDDGCGQEQTAALCPVVNDYWQAVPERFVNTCRLVDVCEWQWPRDSGLTRDDNKAWSAAFVSAMMARAGFTTTEFMPTGRHALYIEAARDGYASAYEVVRTPSVVSPGDVICSSRGRSRYRIDPSTLHAIGAGDEMHCDIVVAVNTPEGHLEAIGGNVKQTVAKTIVPIDADGRLQYDASADRNWVLAMRARTEAGGFAQGAHGH